MSLQKIIIVLIIIAAITGIGTISLSLMHKAGTFKPEIVTPLPDRDIGQQPSVQQKQDPLTNTNRDPETLHVPDMIFGIVGAVRGIEGKNLIIEGTILSEIPPTGGTDLFQEVKTVAITDTTRLTKTTFTRKTDLANEPPKMVPEQISITFEALKVGMQIQALAGKNIPNTREFTAASLNVLP